MFFLRKKKVRGRSKNSRSTHFYVHILRGGAITIGVVLFFVGIYHLTRLETFTITSAHIEGGKTISHDEVRSRVDGALIGTYWGLVPKRFVFTYPQSSIEASLQKISGIHSIIIERDSLTRLSVVFDEYVPYALWCGTEENAQCYFLNQEGYAFAPAPDLQGSSLLRYYTEATSNPVAGESFDTQFLKDMEWFIESIRLLGFRASSVVVRDDGDVEVHISGGGIFLLASKNDITLTFENLEFVLNSDTYKHIEAGSFQYVDVRFDKKVFVNETPPQAIVVREENSTPASAIMVAEDDVSRVTIVNIDEDEISHGSSSPSTSTTTEELPE